jgi:hypothetical protein
MKSDNLIGSQWNFWKTFEHTTILEINHDRKIFASQGWHLNGQGKEMLDKQITSRIYTILGKQVTLLVKSRLEKWKKYTNKYFLIINNSEDHINMKTVKTRAVA